MRNVLIPVALMLLLVPAVGLRADDSSERARLLKTFLDEFVTITPGKDRFPATFHMGSEDGAASERPVHEVRMPATFRIAKYEVPQDLYQAVMGENPSSWRGPRNSAEMMTWQEANEFCTKVTTLLRQLKQIGPDEIVRLPTEAEWEYCCRAGTTTAYSFGDAGQAPGDAGQAGKPARSVCLAHRQRSRQRSSCRGAEAERVGAVRHARLPVGILQRLLACRLRRGPRGRFVPSCTRGAADADCHPQRLVEGSVSPPAKCGPATVPGQRSRRCGGVSVRAGEEGEVRGES